MPRREIFLLTVKGERARPGLTAALTVSACLSTRPPKSTRLTSNCSPRPPKRIPMRSKCRGARTARDAHPTARPSGALRAGV
jgi:hypothetical protein